MYRRSRGCGNSLSRLWRNSKAQCNLIRLSPDLIHTTNLPEVLRAGSLQRAKVARVAEAKKGDKPKKKPKSDKIEKEDNDNFVKSVKEGDYGEADFGAHWQRQNMMPKIVVYANGQPVNTQGRIFRSSTDPLQDGNLEVSAYRLSSRLGLDVVPPTDFYSYGGAGGRATVQKFIENSEDIAKQGKGWNRKVF